MVIWIFVILTFAICQEATEVAESERKAMTIKTLTSFSCEGRVTGYYADVETGCRTYHYCFGSQQYTYECPNNTLFQQRIFICNHWYLVNCDSSEQFYNANLLIGQRHKPFVGEDDASIHQTPSDLQSTNQSYIEEATTYYEHDTNSSFLMTDTAGMTPTEATSRKKTEPTSRTHDSFDRKANVDERLIRLKFPDPRGLFYIPSGNNSVEMLTMGFREFLIRNITKEEVMQFKVDEIILRNLQCPKFCNLRYVRPGTCHPCILIK